MGKILKFPIINMDETKLKIAIPIFSTRHAAASSTSGLMKTALKGMSNIT